MSPEEILNHAKSIGVSVTAEDGTLRVQAAPGVITERMKKKKTLRDNKRDLVGYLSRPPVRKRWPWSLARLQTHINEVENLGDIAGVLVEGNYARESRTISENDWQGLLNRASEMQSVVNAN
jgi:hypothetical protein